MQRRKQKKKCGENLEGRGGEAKDLKGEDKEYYWEIELSFMRRKNTEGVAEERGRLEKNKCKRT